MHPIGTAFYSFYQQGLVSCITLRIPDSDVFYATMSLVCHNQRVELAHFSCLPLNSNGSHSLIRNSTEEMNIFLISTPDSY